MLHHGVGDSVGAGGNGRVVGGSKRETGGSEREVGGRRKTFTESE